MTDPIGVRQDGDEARDEEDLLGPELRVLLASLPKAITPERDLRAHIAARTWDSAAREVRRPVDAGLPGRQSRRPVPGSRTWSGARRWWLAAAAVMLVITSSAVTALVMRSMDRGNAVRLTGGAVENAPAGLEASFAELAVGDEVRLAATEYETAMADLRAVLESNRDALSPGTMEMVEENLAILDSALRETVAALRASPSDLQLRETMVAAYERKLDFLRQAVALTAES